MKQHPTTPELKRELKQELSAAEQVLEQRLQATATPERPLEWHELSAKLGPAHRPKPHWSLWFAPAAVAATVAWLMLIQPQTTMAPQVQQSPMLLAGNYSLDALDKQLQRAYLDGADDTEIDALWQRRAALTAQETSS